MGLLATVLHFLLVLQYGYGIVVYMNGLTPPVEILKLRHIGGGPFKYLTFWDMLLQFSYFTLALVNDIFGSNSLHRKEQTSLQKVRDFVFSTVVFAVGSFVSVSFWGMYNIDRNLIFPKSFDSWFPLWLNHNVHTTPLVGVLTELVCVPHTFPRRWTGFSVVAVFCLIYLAWVCVIAFNTGHWVYPVLAQLSMVGRAAFILAMAFLVSTTYLVGEALNRRVWGSAQLKKRRE